MAIHAQFAIAGIMLIVSTAIVTLALAVRHFKTLLERKSRDTLPPEHGGRTGNKSWVQFRVRYAPLALLFVAFDMEMVFMYPWAVAYKKVGLTAFGDMFVFIAILTAAIVFAWKHGAFDWEE